MYLLSLKYCLFACSIAIQYPKGIEMWPSVKDLKPNIDYYTKNREFIGKEATSTYRKFANYARNGIVDSMVQTKISEQLGSLKTDAEELFKGKFETRTKEYLNFAKCQYLTSKKQKGTNPSCGPVPKEIAFINKGMSVVKETRAGLTKAVKFTQKTLKGTKLLNKINEQYDKGAKFANKIYNKGRKGYEKVKKFGEKIVKKGIKIVRNVANQVSKLMTGSKISKVTTKLLSTFKSLSKIGTFLGPFAAAVGPGLDAITSIISIFCPPPDPTKMIIDHMDAKFKELNENMEKGFADINKNMQEGFNRLSEQMEKGFVMIVEKMVEGFQKASIELENGIQKIRTQINDLSKHIDIAVLMQAIRDYKLKLHSQVSVLMHSYEQYIEDPTNNKTLRQMNAECEKHKPEVLIKLVDESFGEDALLQLEQFADVDFVRLLSLYMLISSDIAHINMIAPTCIAIGSVNTNQCKRTTEVSKRATQMILRMQQRIRKFDKIKKTEFYSRLQTIIMNETTTLNKTKFKDELNEYERFTLAHNLTTLFTNKFPSHMFLVFVNSKEDDFESVVSEKSVEKRVEFHPIHSMLRGVKITVFWHRKEQQPNGELWVRCIHAKAMCWLDQKPSCVLLSLTVPRQNTAQPCKDDSDCYVKKPGKSPTCNDGSYCYKPCSEIFEELDQHCNDTDLGCFVSSKRCYKLGIKSLSRSPYNESLFSTSIDGETCSEKDDVPLVNYVGKYSTPACFIEDNSTKISNLTTPSPTKFFPKAVVFDCLTVFAMPQPVNVIDHLKTELRSENNSYYFQNMPTADWDFKNITNMMDEIQRNHEMISLSYCLLGITVQYSLINTKPKINFATTMNGVLVSNIPSSALDQKYYIIKTAYLRSWNITDKIYNDREISEYLAKNSFLYYRNINEFFRTFLKFHMLQSNYTKIFKLDELQQKALHVFDCFIKEENIFQNLTKMEEAMQECGCYSKPVPSYPTYTFIVTNCGEDEDSDIELEIPDENSTITCEDRHTEAKEMFNQVVETDKTVHKKVKDDEARKKKIFIAKIVCSIIGSLWVVAVVIIGAVVFTRRRKKSKSGSNTKSGNLRKGVGQKKWSILSVKKRPTKSVSSIMQGKSKGNMTKTQTSKTSAIGKPKKSVSSVKQGNSSGKITKSQIKRTSGLGKAPSIGQISKQSNRSSQILDKRLNQYKRISAASVKTAGSAPVKSKTKIQLQKKASQQKKAPSISQISKQSNKSNQGHDKRLNPYKGLSAASLKAANSAPLKSKTQMQQQKQANQKKTSSMANVRSNPKQPLKQQKVPSVRPMKKPISGSKVVMKNQSKTKDPAKGKKQLSKK